MKDVMFNQDVHQYESPYADKVWKNVAAALDKERRKRKIILWFTSIFFLLTLLTVAGYVQESNANISSDIKYELRQSPDQPVQNIPIP